MLQTRPLFVIASLILFVVANPISVANTRAAELPAAPTFHPVPERRLVLPPNDPRATALKLGGALMAGDSLLEPATWKDSGKTQHGLVVRNTATGTARLHPLASAVRGFAYDQERKLVFVRLTRELQILNGEDLSLKQTLPFPVASSWTDMTYASKLLVLEKNRIKEVDTESGRVVSESAELPVKKTQRVISCGEQLLLWSSYSGAQLYPYSLKTGNSDRPVSAGVPHRLLFKVTCLDKEPAVIDATSGALIGLYRFDSTFVRRDPGLSVSADGGALRSRPEAEEITYTLRIVPTADSNAGHAVILLPSASTLTQEMDQEQFPKASEIRLDQDGNRGMFFELPALRRDVPFELAVYRARLTRYRLDIDLSRYRTPLARPIPNELAHYLVDLPQLQLRDPEIESTQRRLRAGDETVESYADTAFREVKTRLRYKGDGRFDSAPVVLKQGHGSCTEHTYALMALYRAAGIPARMVWNYLGRDEPSFNHKYPELWHPALGWLPAETLAPPRRVGTSYAKHIVFTRLRTPYQEWMGKSDRLVTLRGARGKADVRISLVRAATRGPSDSSADELPAGKPVAPPAVRGAGKRRVVE